MSGGVALSTWERTVRGKRSRDSDNSWWLYANVFLRALDCARHEPENLHTTEQRWNKSKQQHTSAPKERSQTTNVGKNHLLQRAWTVGSTGTQHQISTLRQQISWALANQNKVSRGTALGKIGKWMEMAVVRDSEHVMSSSHCLFKWAASLPSSADGHTTGGFMSILCGLSGSCLIPIPTVYEATVYQIVTLKRIESNCRNHSYLILGLSSRPNPSPTLCKEPTSEHQARSAWPLFGSWVCIVHKFISCTYPKQNQQLELQCVHNLIWRFKIFKGFWVYHRELQTTKTNKFQNIIPHAGCAANQKEGGPDFF